MMMVQHAKCQTVLLAILLLVMMLSETSAQKPAAGRARPVDCGQDFDCFIRQAQTCTPARLVRTDDIDFFGMQQKSTTEYELGGLRAGVCRYTQRALALNVKFGAIWRQKLREEGQTDAQIAELERTALERLRAEGKDRMTCEFPVPRLLEILTAVKQGGFDARSEDARYCPGPAAPAIGQAGGLTAAPGAGGAGGGPARIHLRSGVSFDVPRWWYQGDLLYYERFGGVVSVPRSDVERIEP
jgi:hypothetical protein